MSSTGPVRKKEEHAPSLFGWVRSAAAKTRDEAEMNPRIGQVNVGVSQPQRRGLRVPRGAVGWIVSLAVIALVALVVVPAVIGFVDGVGKALEESFEEGPGGSGSGSGRNDLGPSESDRLQRRARRVIEGQGSGNSFSLANCVTAAAGDPAAIAECNQRLLDQIDVPEAPAAPAPEFDELNQMADCVERAGSDIDRMVECTRR